MANPFESALSIPPTGTALLAVNARTYLASEVAPLDGDLNAPNAGTDCSVGLNALFATATEDSPVWLLVDGVGHLAAPLVIRSHCHIKVKSASCGFTLADEVNRPMVWNANLTADTRVDHDFSIEGGTWNANGANQAASFVHLGGFNFVCGMTFCGCYRFQIKNLEVRNARSFAFQISNWADVVYRDLRAYWNIGVGVDFNDGYHFNGPGIRFSGINLYSNGANNADCFGLNADETADDGQTYTYLGSGGEITEVEIDGLNPDGCGAGFRIVSDAARVDRVSVRNIHGSTKNSVLLFQPVTVEVGTGNIGTVTVDGVDVVSLGGGDSTFADVVHANLSMDRLVLRNLNSNNTDVDQRGIRVMQYAAIKHLAIDGYYIWDSTNAHVSDAYGRIHVEGGTVETLSVSGLNWQKASTANVGRVIVIEGGSVSELQIAAIGCNNVSAIVDHTGGALGKIIATNVNNRGSIAAAFQTASTVALLSVSGWAGGNVIESGAFSVKTGDAFDRFAIAAAAVAPPINVSAWANGPEPLTLSGASADGFSGEFLGSSGNIALPLTVVSGVPIAVEFDLSLDSTAIPFLRLYKGDYSSYVDAGQITQGRVRVIITPNFTGAANLLIYAVSGATIGDTIDVADAAVRSAFTPAMHVVGFSGGLLQIADGQGNVYEVAATLV